MLIHFKLRLENDSIKLLPHKHITDVKSYVPLFTSTFYGQGCTYMSLQISFFKMDMFQNKYNTVTFFVVVDINTH